MNLLFHRELPSAEIQVTPLEGTDFTPAQSRGEFQQKEFKATVLLGLDQ